MVSTDLFIGFHDMIPTPLQGGMLMHLTDVISTSPVHDETVVSLQDVL